MAKLERNDHSRILITLTEDECEALKMGHEVSFVPNAIEPLVVKISKSG
jgi:hypothetical protein